MKQKVQQRIVLGREAAKPLPGLEDVLFVTKHGTPMNVQNMKDSIKRIVDEINLMRDCDYSEQMEYFGGHTFRHTFATRCYEANVPIKSLQKMLGHASIQMTMDLYAHEFDDHTMEQVTKMETAMGAVFESGDYYAEDRYEKLVEKEKEDAKKVVRLDDIRFA